MRLVRNLLDYPSRWQGSKAPLVVIVPAFVISPAAFRVRLTVALALRECPTRAAKEDGTLVDMVAPGSLTISRAEIEPAAFLPLGDTA